MASAMGNLQKMPVRLEAGEAQYTLQLGEQQIALNSLVGEKIRLDFQQEINCIHCGRKTSKSFSQGYCFPCFKKLARCDSCIVKPETCHFDQGTCREPDWAQQFCFTDHMVYLANSSGLKVGITRMNQIPTRWIDQGAIQALPLVRVSDRKLSGLVETFLARDISDKTSWQAMLKGQTDELDLEIERARLAEKVLDYINNDLQVTEINRYLIQNSSQISIKYPVIEYPTKVVSLNFDKNPLVEGRLMGIKGQYLILDTGVINIRKFGGYRVAFDVP